MSFSPNFLQSHFYKTILKLKTRLKQQSLQKMLVFFHYHLNLFICCKTEIENNI